MASKVPFDAGEIKRCICPSCPVQIMSACVVGKESAMDAAGPGGELKPEDVPRLYCSTGVASCKDIDVEKKCICDSCPVWKDFGLSDGKPAYHFCRDGTPK
jgi:hypothetical protein